MHYEWILHVGLILLAAKIGGELFQRLGMSAVVGEIGVGMLLGPSVLNWVPESELVVHLSELGVIFMIFLLGLETKISHVLEVGATAALVALGGALVPLAMGYGLGVAVGLNWQASLFLGALLTATSIAISTRVFLDCGLGRTRITRTILAAAVIDDVVGLIGLTAILAVTGHGEGSVTSLLARSALVFLVGFPAALYLIPRLVSRVSRLQGAGALFVIILGSTLLASYGVVLAGLEPIIGAFLIGIVFGSSREAIAVEEEVSALVHFLGPIFFVHVGMMIDVAALGHGLGLAMVITVVACLGKLVGCGGVAWLSRMSPLESLTIGVGMMPRGEVGLIIAGIGARIGLFDDRVFSAAALMCVLTIVVVPPLLRPLARMNASSTGGTTA